MRIFWTQSSYRAAVRAELRQLPDASDLMTLYSENPALLRKARAAFENVSEKAMAHMNVTENSIMFTPMSRAIRAFAIGLREHREADAKT